MKKLKEQDVCIGSPFSPSKIMSSDENGVYQAWAQDKFLWDQEVRERRAKERGIEIGEKKGREEGRKEGIEIGEKKGREEREKKGREEGLIEAARKLISNGMDKKTVCEMLGISESGL